MSESRAAFDYIVAATGWTEAEAAKRLFYVGVNFERSFDLLYEESYRSVKAQVNYFGRDWSGLFVVFVATPPTADLPPDQVAKWLTSQGIETSLKNNIEDGSIKLGPVQSFTHLVLLPYEAVPTENYSPYFQNLGAPYTDVDRELAPYLAAERSGIEVLPGGNFLFHWNVGKCSSCGFAARVHLGTRTETNVQLDVEWLGVPLSEPSFTIHPRWVQNLVDAYVEVKCDGDAPKKLLMPSIGYVWWPPPQFDSARSILAPFERRLTFPCAKTIRSIEVGWARSKSEQSTGST